MSTMKQFHRNVHTCRVSRHEQRNKMSLQNLATVFGPTVLRPSKRNTIPKTTEQLFFLAANEAIVQTTVLYHILSMRANGAEFERFKSY
jgi:RhoGAP domain